MCVLTISESIASITHLPHSQAAAGAELSALTCLLISGSMFLQINVIFIKINNNYSLTHSTILVS